MVDKRYVVSKQASVQEGRCGLLDKMEREDGSASEYVLFVQPGSDHARVAANADWASGVVADRAMGPAIRGEPDGISNADGLNGRRATMPVRLGAMGAFQCFMITGGPYKDFPGRGKAYGVCLTAETMPPTDGFDVHLPMIDHRVPFNLEATRQALVLTLKAALEGKTVYVGCRDGGNRMEVFLALLGKVTGQSGWVSHLRTYDAERSPATDEQRRYVRDFDAQDLTAWLYRQAWYTVWDKAVGRRRLFRWTRKCT